MTGAMIQALHAEKPNATLADKLQLYGQFVGAWRLDIAYHTFAGAVLRDEGEWHFAWVLDGKAIQDVWIFPARDRRDPAAPVPWHMYGTTFRWYDPALDAWHINWFDPSRPMQMRQLGRAMGKDIVQTGEDQGGFVRRWRFTDIARDSFRWLGDASWDRGATWTLEMEMKARRVA
jgi:hypothetical protein